MTLTGRKLAMATINDTVVQLIPAFDIVVAILVTLYISVAIFAAQNIFKTSPESELNISGRHYVKLLRFSNISVLLLLMPFLVKLSGINILDADYNNVKAPVIFLILIAIAVVVLLEIRGIITQKTLKGKRITNIKHPSLRFAAWLIDNEVDWSLEKRDLMASSLTGFNKSSVPYEEFVLGVIKDDTNKLLSAKSKQREQGEYLVSLLNIYKDNLDKRPLSYPLYINSLFEYLFHSWEAVNKDADPYKAGGVYNLRLAILHNINSLAKYCLGESALSYDLFINLEKFLNGLSEDDVTKFMVNFDDKIFFEYIPQSPENYIIWPDSFPKEWFFSYENLVEKPNVVAASLFNHFLSWAQNRFFRDKGIDTDLDDVASHLFPDVDPIIWARVLEYRYAPWVGDNHLRYIISKVSTFGFGKSYSVQNYVDDATTIEHMKDEDAVMMAATIKLANGIGLFNEKMLDSALAEAKELEKDKNLDEREKRKLAQHKRIFTELKKALPKPPKAKR